MLEILLLSLLTLLQFADGYTTYLILSKGGKEVNPMLALTFDTIGLIPGLLLYKTIAVACGYYVYLVAPIYFVAFLVALYTFVVWHNIVELRK